MTDDLRTRIAAALARADQDWCSDRPLYEDMADAVIRELQLGKEFGCGTSDVRHGCRCSHRYVTEWETGNDS